MESAATTDRRVGLLYDPRMCNHFSLDNANHDEHPGRIRSIWNKLQNTGIIRRCKLLDAVYAKDEDIMAVHSDKHVKLVKYISQKKANVRRNLAMKQNDVYFNDGSTEAAYLAAGSAVEVAKRVASKEFDSAAAIIRPPGHHAEYNGARGYCLFNNVAIAATYLLNNTDVKKILIVDWDVHHGNGTQLMFYDDPRVLFFSVHRHDSGDFYPFGDEGSYDKIGKGDGIGYNINVPWKWEESAIGDICEIGDADYLAMWDHILLPVAEEFGPSIILLSAGFDAAAGDPLGMCSVTPLGFSMLLRKLMNLAEGRIVMLLEGGYNLDSISSSMQACLEVLLEDKPLVLSCDAHPLLSTWNLIEAVRKKFSPYWPSLMSSLPPFPDDEVEKKPEDEIYVDGKEANLPKQQMSLLMKELCSLNGVATAALSEANEIKSDTKEVKSIMKEVLEVLKRGAL